jgi:hypothetical protein
VALIMRQASASVIAFDLLRIGLLICVLRLASRAFVRRSRTRLPLPFFVRALRRAPSASASRLANLAFLASIPLLMAFQSFKHLFFGLEPIIECGARLIAALDVKFVRATADQFFKRNRIGRGFRCFSRCGHGITSGDEAITDGL